MHFLFIWSGSLPFSFVCVYLQTSLLQVGSHVWIGCSDKSITVVEAENGQGELEGEH